MKKNTKKQEAKRLDRWAIGLLIALILLFVVTSILKTEIPIFRAPDQPPPTFHDFYGTVNCTNNHAVPYGNQVIAIISSNQFSTLVANGEYYLTIENGIPGENIDFLVGSENVSDDTFQPFGDTQKNFEVSNTFCGLSDPGGSAGGGSSGGGGGGGGGSSRRTQCNDGKDNDNDTKKDYPNDPGCSSKTDENEADPVASVSRCNDNIDNDGDGKIDLADQGCINKFDSSEEDVVVGPPELPANPETTDLPENNFEGFINIVTTGLYILILIIILSLIYLYIKFKSNIPKY